MNETTHFTLKQLKDLCRARGVPVKGPGGGNISRHGLTNLLLLSFYNERCSFFHPSQPLVPPSVVYGGLQLVSE